MLIAFDKLNGIPLFPDVYCSVITFLSLLTAGNIVNEINCWEFVGLLSPVQMREDHVVLFNITKNKYLLYMLLSYYSFYQKDSRSMYLYIKKMVI